MVSEVEESDDLDVKAVKTIRNNIISIIEQDLIKIGSVIERDLSILLYIYNNNYYLIRANTVKNNNTSKIQCLLFHENTMILDIDYYVNYSHKV